MKQVLLALLPAILLMPAVQAQPSKLLEKKLELQMPDGNGANGASVAFHTGNKLYYSAIAGNSTYALALFTEQGKKPADGECETMIDVRGLWFNAKRGKLVGNAYADGGWFEYVLGKDKLPTEVKVLVKGQTQPDKQSVGAFDVKTNEVLFFDGYDIVFYKADGEVANTWHMEELLEEWDELEYEAEDYNQSIVYTGKAGMEYGLLNTAANRIELFGRNKKRTAFLMLPVDQPVYEMFNFAYANGYFFLFDKDKRSWTGYREGAAAPAKPKPQVAATSVAPAVSKPGPTPGFAMPALSRSKPARISNAADVFTSYNLGGASSKLDGWRNRYSPAFVTELQKRSNEKGWPPGIADFDSRDQNRELFKQLKTFYFDDVDAHKVILWVPAADNKSMPASMQAGFDYFLVVRKSGISYSGVAASQSNGAATSKGNLGSPLQDMTPEKYASIGVNMFSPTGKRTIIDEPGDVYPNWNLQQETALLQKWTSLYGQAKVTELVRRANGAGWPDGINSSAKREGARTSFKNAIAYYFDDVKADKVLLYVPAAQNQHMKDAWGELKDFFMVMNASAVRLGDKIVGGAVAQAATGSFAARRTIIQDAGKLYTTVQLEGSALYSRLKQAYGEEQAAWIARRVQEKNYPQGINTLAGWRQHRGDYNLYNAYYLEDVEGNRLLLWIPMAENKHMPADMQDGADLYLIIGKEGVVMGDRISLHDKKLNNKVYGTNMEIVLPRQNN